jgi:hypothetical protein
MAANVMPQLLKATHQPQGFQYNLDLSSTQIIHKHSLNHFTILDLSEKNRISKKI